MRDEQIISLYWNRDEAAIRATDEKYGIYCLSIAVSVLADREDAEECVNDTWLRTWNSIPPARPSFLKQFLAKITRHLSFDKYRKKTAAKRGGGETALALEELGECIAGSGDAAAEMEAKELAIAINSFLQTIRRRDGDIFLRRYFYVETMEQIAERFGLSEQNVRAILSRSRRKLRDYLRKEGFLQ